MVRTENSCFFFKCSILSVEFEIFNRCIYIIFLYLDLIDSNLTMTTSDGASANLDATGSFYNFCIFVTAGGSFQ